MTQTVELMYRPGTSELNTVRITVAQTGCAPIYFFDMLENVVFSVCEGFLPNTGMERNLNFYFAVRVFAVSYPLVDLFVSPQSLPVDIQRLSYYNLVSRIGNLSLQVSICALKPKKFSRDDTCSEVRPRIDVVYYFNGSLAGVTLQSFRQSQAHQVQDLGGV